MIIIDYAKCPPCSMLLCVGVCPFGALEEDPNGKPKIENVESCTQCEVCVNLCPAKAISKKNAPTREK
jgi:NAD-dependent dihydropyrimidine dehydrogenase PreA subunit